MCVCVCVHIQAPILFFLRTPVGDVLNSFAKDQDTLDETLPDTIHMSTIYLMILLTSLAIVTVSIYYYAALTAALLASFLMMQFLYLPAATVLKRWAGETASQVSMRLCVCVCVCVLASVCLLTLAVFLSGLSTKPCVS